MPYPTEIANRLDDLAHVSGGPYDAVGVHANLDCGCVVRFGIAIDTAAGSVATAGFTTNGCGYLVAAAEIIAAELSARPLAQLKGNAVKSIETILTEALDDVPDCRRECLNSALAAAASAFVRQRQRQSDEFVGEAALICTCFGVTDDRIREMIASRRARTVRQVGELTNAGTGCGSCQMLIREILDGAESESEEFAAS